MFSSRIFILLPFALSKSGVAFSRCCGLGMGEGGGAGGVSFLYDEQKSL